MKRIIKMFIWSIIWLIAFWTFLIITFPSESARDWLINRIQKGNKIRVSIEKLSLRWNINVELKSLLVSNIDSNSNASDIVNPIDLMVFSIKMDSLVIKPSLLSLTKMRPSFDFVGNLPTGGIFTGSFNTGDLSLSFKDISFKDVTLPSIPIPSSASISGKGLLKIINGKGLIEIDLDGIPGGKQKIKINSGDSPGMEGKVSIMVLFR